jgi:diguanylate cyclase (GGDEF)-like protein
MIKVLNIRYHHQGDLLPAEETAEGYRHDQILIQVFCGVMDTQVVESLIEEIRSVFPGTAIIGTSTSGEIMDGEALEEEIIVNFSFFSHTRVRTTLITQNDDLTRAGADIATSLRQDDTKALILFGCGLKEGNTINGEPLLAAVQSGMPGVVIAGAQAGDNGEGLSTFVFTEEGLTRTGVAAAALSGDRLVVNNTYNLSWVPIGKKLTITQAKGSRVYTIDNRSAYDLYCHYLGQEVADNLPLSAADFPLIIERDGIPMAIHATGVNDDGSFDYIHDFHAGEQLKFGFCHAGLLAIGAEITHKELQAFNAEAIFVYSCVSRKWILGEDISIELAAVSDLAPSAGFFAYGEYFSHNNKKAYFFSQTMTVLTLSETMPREDEQVSTTNGFDSGADESRQFRTLRVLHRLIETSAKEIEAMNRELAGLARRDSLTGLFNRRRFDENLTRELQRRLRAYSPLSLILVDADYFKAYNDIYGHVPGDDCLRGIAQVISTIVKRPSDTAARYGGEEFACILPDTDFCGAMKIAGEIRSAVEDLAIPHKGSPVSGSVTVSLGLLTLDSCDNLGPREFVDACDQLLYQAKSLGRNQIAADRLD